MSDMEGLRARSENCSERLRRRRRCRFGGSETRRNIPHVLHCDVRNDNRSLKLCGSDVSSAREEQIGQCFERVKRSYGESEED